MKEFKTKVYLATLDGQKDDLGTICTKAADIEALRDSLPIVAAPLLHSYGSQLVFVTTEVKPQQSFFSDFFNPIWKAKKQ